MHILFRKFREIDPKRTIKRMGKASPGNVPSKWTIKDAGVCINDIRIVSAQKEECSTGSVRKLRNTVKNDDGKCGTCPYFFSDELLWEIYRSGVCDEDKLCKTKIGIMRLVARTRWDINEEKLIGDILKLNLCEKDKCYWVKKYEEDDKNG